MTIHLKQVTESSLLSREGKFNSTFWWKSVKEFADQIKIITVTEKKRLHVLDGLPKKFTTNNWSEIEFFLSLFSIYSSFLPKLIYRYWLHTVSPSVNSIFNAYWIVAHWRVGLFCCSFFKHHKSYSSGGQNTAVPLKRLRGDCFLAFSSVCRPLVFLGSWSLYHSDLLLSCHFLFCIKSQSLSFLKNVVK